MTVKHEIEIKSDLLENLQKNLIIHELYFCYCLIVSFSDKNEKLNIR